MVPKLLKGYCAVRGIQIVTINIIMSDFAISKSSNMFCLDLAQFSSHFTFFCGGKITWYLPWSPLPHVRFGEIRLDLTPHPWTPHVITWRPLITAHKKNCCRGGFISHDAYTKSCISHSFKCVLRYCRLLLILKNRFVLVIWVYRRNENKKFEEIPMWFPNLLEKGLREQRF